MKFFTLVTAIALGATVDAQRNGPPAWYTAQQGRPTAAPNAYNPYQYGPPSQYGPPPASTAKGGSGSNSLGNPGIPVGQTKTIAADKYGNFKTIIPNIPTAIPSVSVSASPSASPSAGAGGNSTSTTNSTLISTSDDAKKNPNLPNSALHRGNWAPGFDINTDAESTWPNTGKVVKYTLTVTNGTISPQGDSKIGFLINGQFPGPRLEANWGDTFEITVVNNLQHNGTSFHWHGFTQKKSNLQDGVGGVTECPIAPNGGSRVYRFQATQYGTFWYHSHFSAQYADGVLGPIIVNGPASYNYDIDLGTVMISEHYPLTAFQEEWLATRFGPPTATNYLLNGKNVKTTGSGGSRSQWTFQPGKKHLMRFMNAGADNHFKVQIDGHSLIVISSDLTPIQPYRTNELSIATGQRYDVIVEANQTPGNFWLRAMIAADCSFNNNDGTGIANGIISYSGAAGGLPTTKPFTHSNACVDEPMAALKPIVTIPVDSGSFAASVAALPVSAGVVQTNNDTVFKWTVGGISQKIDWADPTMANAGASANSVYDAAKAVLSLPKANAWSFWVLQNQFFVPHPMHVHGHNFVVLGQGNGVFNTASAPSTLNFKDPPRRDTVNLVAQGWTVVAFKTDNPGAWLMHCHIAWHVSGGLSLQYLERPSEIPGIYGSQVADSSFKNQCAAWKKYAATMVYPQSDSGLKRREIVGDVEMEMFELEVLPERRSVESPREMVKRKVRHFI